MSIGRSRSSVKIGFLHLTVMNNSAWEAAAHLERATQEREVSEVTADPKKKSRGRGRRKKDSWQSMEEVVKKRPIISARERGPGPGRYALPPTVGYMNHDFTKPSSPAYSFHSRMSSAMVSVDSSPGPRYLIDAKVTRFGRMETPSYSILGRGRLIGTKGELFQTPGPGAYSPEKAPPHNAQRRPPSYTMGSRTRYRSVDAVPAPNRNALNHWSWTRGPLRVSHRVWNQGAGHGSFGYSGYSLPNLLGCQVPHKPSSASYSFSGRRKVGAPSEDLSMSPGPGKYNSTNPDIYHQRQPSFSMQSRTKRPNYSSAIPGPGTYSPERSHMHLPKPPSFTLGVRHSEFVTPLVVHVID